MHTHNIILLHRGILIYTHIKAWRRKLPILLPLAFDKNTLNIFFKSTTLMNGNYGPFRRKKLMGIMVTYFYFIFKLLIYINFFSLTTMLSFFPMVVLSAKWRRFFYPRMHGAHFVVWLSSSWIKILEEKLCSGVVKISANGQ